MRRASTVLLGMLWVCLPQLCFAWGQDGHETVAFIAQKHLTDGAGELVERLLDVEGIESGDLQEVAMWADKRQRGPKHYVNVPRQATDVEENRDCSNDCALTAIAKAVEVLEEPFDESGGSDVTEHNRDQAQALKELVHYVGDLHQPLHVSFAEDHGANDIKAARGSIVRGKLHSIWDSGLIKHRISRKDGDEADTFKSRLNNGISDEDASAWTESMDADAWAEESLEITLALYEQMANDDQEDGKVRIDATYFNDNIDTIELRIKKAGIRLATLLNKIAAE